jgi:CRISPR/Cas system CSM-associated protein Csm4 (group 5 of RAMP superfamily)
LSRRDFQTQQAKLKTEGGLARFVEARQTIPEDQECIANERELDTFIAASFKRIKYFTEEQFAEYESGMLKVIAQCKNDSNKKRGSADANYNRKFLRDAQKE